MVIKFHQLSFSNMYQECEDILLNDKPKFLELLSKHLDLSSLIQLHFIDPTIVN